MKHLELVEHNQVFTVRLNRPEKHNAFHPEMIAELTLTFRDLEQRTELRAVVLEGAGPSFSAGGDLEWMRSMVNYSFAENAQDTDRLFAMFESMALLSLPVLGVVHGHVMGGGLGLLAVCDAVTAESATRLSFSEARIGLSPGVISPWVLRKVPQGFARDVMLTARVFDAQEAKTMGLVHHVGTRDEGQIWLRSKLNEIMQCAPQAVRESKKLMNFISSQAWPLQRAKATQVIAERRVSAEGQEGLRSFLEKRAPSWRAK